MALNLIFHILIDIWGYIPPRSDTVIHDTVFPFNYCMWREDFIIIHTEDNLCIYIFFLLYRSSTYKMYIWHIIEFSSWNIYVYCCYIIYMKATKKYELTFIWNIFMIWTEKKKERKYTNTSLICFVFQFYFSFFFRRRRWASHKCKRWKS